MKFLNFDPLKISFGGNGGKGWGSPATDLRAKYSLKGTTSPDHPLYFWGAFEKCPKFDPTLGAGKVPNFRAIPLQTLTIKWRYFPDRSPLERCSCGPPLSLKICPRFCPAVFVRKKIFQKIIFFAQI